MTEYATNAVLLGSIPQLPLQTAGLVVAADAVRRSVLVAWAGFDAANGWLTGERWVALDAHEVMFLTRCQVKDVLVELHSRLRGVGRVVRFAPACGHLDLQSALRDYCPCADGPVYPGAVAAVTPSPDGEEVAGGWVSYHDHREQGPQFVAQQGGVPAGEVSDLGADELAELMAPAPRDPWDALLALGVAGLSNPQQDLLRGNLRNVLHGLVAVGDRVLQVVASDGDELVVHAIGAVTARNDHGCGDVSFSVGDPAACEDNRYDPDVTPVIVAGGVLGRISRHLTQPVTLQQWLSFHDRLIADTLAEGVGEGRS